MKLQLVGIGMVGIFAALSAGLLVAASGAREQPAAMTKPLEEIDIITAAHAVPALTPVDESHIVTRRIAKNQAPKDFFSAPVQVIGQVLTVPLVQGQALTKSCFAPDGSGFHIAATLPEGMRAMSVSLAEHARLDGLLYPGSVVDVLVAFRLGTGGASGTRAEIVSVTLLECIQVLAVQERTVSRAEEESRPPERQLGRQRRVTLMVTSKQAEALQLAAEHGEITLALRNPRDTAPSRKDLTRLGDLSPRLIELLSPEEASEPAPAAAGPVPEPEPEPAPPLAPPPEPIPEPAAETPRPERPSWITRVLKGGVSTTQSFPVDEELPAEQR